MKRVKRILFVAVLMAMGTSLLITSCTNRETEEPKEAVSTISQPEIIQQLEAFNATLGATGTRMPMHCPHTAGQELCWQCWLKILMRDVRGTFYGALNGPKLTVTETVVPQPLKLCAYQSAIIMGSGSSYMGCILRGKDQSTSSQTNSTKGTKVTSKDFAAGYACVKNKVKSSDLDLGMTLGLDSISISVGILHNKILEEVDDIIEKGNQDELLDKLSEEEKKFVTSQDFSKSFDIIVGSSAGLAHDITEEIVVPTYEKILMLFEDALNVSSMDKETVQIIIMKYISSVQKSKELTDKEKQCLYLSFAVAWYSYHYWENWNLTHTYVED